MSTKAVTHQRTPLSAIVVNVVLIHAAVLVLMNQPSALVRPPPATTQASTPLKAMALRTIEQTPAKPAPLVLAAAEPSAAPSLPRPVPKPEQAPVETAAPTPTETPAPQAEQRPLATPVAEPSTDDSYLPRPLLTITPAPSVPVIVPFPRQVARPGRYTATLALFIDENGVVRRVRVEGPPAPQPMQDAARETFLQAHFSPGQLEGQNVKSLIRVEVVFDNSPMGGSTETRSL